MMWPTWVLTVASEMGGTVAISVLDKPEPTGARIGARGDLQLRLAVEAIILGDDGYLLVILVRPGMKVRPVHLQRVVARPDGQQVALAGV
jgi:hypothetical protein